MEPNFQVETAHNEDAYHNMITVHYSRHQKNSIKMLYALAVAFAALMYLVTAAGNLTSIRAIGTGVFTAAVAILLVPYIDRFSAAQVCGRMKRSVVKAAKKNDIYGIPTRYRFYDFNLDAADGGGSVETAYSRITDLVETEEYFLLFVDNGQCILARKSDFTQGSADDFAAFISKATGKKMDFFEMPKRRR